RPGRVRRRPAGRGPASGGTSQAAERAPPRRSPPTALKTARRCREIRQGTDMSAEFPVARPRRLRRTPALRRLVAETSLRPGDLVLPTFIKEGLTEPQPI